MDLGIFEVFSNLNGSVVLPPEGRSSHRGQGWLCRPVGAHPREEERRGGAQGPPLSVSAVVSIGR